MYIDRIASQRLILLAENFPVVVISGARQVGKSTLIKHLFSHSHDYVVFDPAIDVENARHDPELFFDNHPGPLILDEIQYAPELLSSIKRRVDLDRSPGRFIITGSQQWGVLSSMAESLAGRAVFLDLEGFCLAENSTDSNAGNQDNWLAAWLDGPEQFIQKPPRRLTSRFTVYEQIWRGWLPETIFLTPEIIADFHAAYLRTYIERDARLLGNVSDWQLFGRFFQLTAALTASEINHSQLGRELGISPITARRWLSTLSATYQWFEIPAYSGNVVKRISNRPKGYIADTGFACYAQAVSSARALGGHPLWGALFETAVAGEIRKLSQTISPRPQIYHWRTHAGAEVDLILERDGILFPVEIKAASNPSRRSTSGISAFRKTYPDKKIAPGLVIAPTDAFRKLSETDYALPWDSIPQ